MNFTISSNHPGKCQSKDEAELRWAWWFKPVTQHLEDGDRQIRSLRSSSATYECEHGLTRPYLKNKKKLKGGGNRHPPMASLLGRPVQTCPTEVHSLLQSPRLQALRLPLKSAEQGLCPFQQEQTYNCAFIQSHRRIIQIYGNNK